MISKMSSFSNKLLNFAIAVSLASMSLAVFGNVVLRYVFNSGLTWSEEMSRYLFVWMVFLGAIAALKDKMHLGVDIVVNALPKGLQKVVFIISNAIVLYLLWLVLEGSWKMTLLNMNSTGPATGMPLSYMYGIGIVSSIWMMILIISSLFLAIKGKSESLTIIQSSEDVLSEVNSNQEDNILAK